MNKNVKSGIIILLCVLTVLFSFGSLTGCSENTDKPAAFSAQISEGPKPGNVFREYAWAGPYRNAAKWQRVTDPEATNAAAIAFIPNKENSIDLPDLEGAVKVEMVVEMWGGHVGTSDKRVRMNGNSWIAIPEIDTIGPGKPESYQQFRFPAVEIPLSQLVQGANTFEFTSGKQVTHSFGWGQWAFTGVVFRIYYDPEKMKQYTGVKAPKINKNNTSQEALDLSLRKASSESVKIKSVDYIGYYEDFDMDGDGNYEELQYAYRHGVLIHHVGSAEKEPFPVKWDTTWVPDQAKAMAVTARVNYEDGIIYMTDFSKGYTLDRTVTSVQLYKPYNTPEKWNSRAKRTLEGNVFVGYQLKDAVEAKMLLTTFNGEQCNEIGFNGNKVVDKVGLDHDYSFDILPVPLSLLKDGENVTYTYAETAEHGIEVSWPGIALKVRYNKKASELAPNVKATPSPTSEAVSNAGTPSAVSVQEGVYVFEPGGDASVIKDRPGENLGKGDTIGLFNKSQYVKEGFLRFNVQGLKGNVEKAVLKLYYQGKADGDVTGKTAVWSTNDSNWDELIINWDNRPQQKEKLAEYDNPQTYPMWVEVDLTSHITGDGQYSFNLATDCATRTTFVTKEYVDAKYHPVLEITCKEYQGDSM